MSQPTLTPLGAANEKETGRVEAFSDGVFAIAITLLVLELKVPEGAGDSRSLGAALMRNWPSYAAFLTSFATVGIIWLNHHRLFTLIYRTDHSLLLLNTAVLFAASIVPFPTAIVAMYIRGDAAHTAAALYAGTFLIVAVAYNALWRYASSPRRVPSMLRVPLDHPSVRAIDRQYRLGPLWYLIALALAYVDGRLSVAACSGLALFFAWPPRSALSTFKPGAPEST